MGFRRKREKNTREFVRNFLDFFLKKKKKALTNN